MDNKPLQYEKVPSPIVVTLLGMFTEVKPLQSEKAPSPIVVTLAGMFTEVKPLQPEKANLSIVVTPSGITISPSASLAHLFNKTLPFFSSIVNQLLSMFLFFSIVAINYFSFGLIVYKPFIFTQQKSCFDTN